MKKLLPFLVIAMLFIAGGTSYYAYATYKDSKIDDKEIVDNTEQENNISNTNDLIKLEETNSPISISFKTSLTNHIVDTNSYQEKIVNLLNSTSAKNSQIYDAYSELAVFLNSAGLSPSNGVEKELSEHVDDMIYSLYEHSKYSMKYYSKNEKHNKSLADNYYNDYRVRQDLLFKTLDSYGIK